jgi:hypothetical protein
MRNQTCMETNRYVDGNDFSNYLSKGEELFAIQCLCCKLTCFVSDMIKWGKTFIEKVTSYVNSQRFFPFSKNLFFFSLTPPKQIWCQCYKSFQIFVLVAMQKS